MPDSHEKKALLSAKDWIPVICLILAGLGWLVQRTWSYYADRPKVSVSRITRQCRAIEDNPCSTVELTIVIGNSGKEAARDISAQWIYKAPTNTMMRMLGIGTPTLIETAGTEISLDSGKTVELDGGPESSGHVAKRTERLVAGLIFWSDQISIRHQIDFCFEQDGENGEFAPCSNDGWVQATPLITQIADPMRH